FRLAVNAQARQLKVRLLKKSKEQARELLPIALAPLPAPSPGEGRFACPEVCTGGGSVAFSGAFDDNWSDTRLMAGGPPAAMLAGSPREAVFSLPPELAAGPTELVLREGNVQETHLTSIVWVTARIGKPGLRRGGTGWVSG